MQISNSKSNKNLFDNFRINSKNIILKISIDKTLLDCLCILDDGRLVSCSINGYIVIYNKITFQPDLKIKENYHRLKYIIKLQSSILASCSSDIKLFKIKNKNYEILQTLKYHEYGVNK